MRRPFDETLEPSDDDAPLWEPSSPAEHATVRAPRQERYVLGGEIARGGFGRIVAAEDQVLGRSIAVKEPIQDSPGNRARFLREIRITARLQHPAIVPLYDAIVGEDGRPRYAMKLVAGTTLAKAIRGAGTLDERLALLPHLVAVTDAVSYAHAQGVIHRDIKPQNILIGSYGETLLIDWGVAKDLGDTEVAGESDADAGEQGMTRVGAVVGTPAYMAPEQARGEPADRRVDVYALGATLYHLLAGQPPHPDDDEAVSALATRRGPTPLDALVAEVPPDLASIVRKAMAEDLLTRYASGQELREDLRRFTTGQLVAARRYTRADLLRRWLVRHRVVVGVVLLALLVVLGSGAVAAVQVVKERNAAQAAQAVAEARSDALTLAHAARSSGNDPTEAVSWLQAYPIGGTDTEQLFMLTQDVVARGVARVVARPPTVVCNTPLFTADGSALLALSETTTRMSTRTGEVSALGVGGQLHIGAALGDDEALVVGPQAAIFRVDAAGQARKVTTLPAPPVSIAARGAVAVVGDRSGGITWIDLATGATQPLVSANTPVNSLTIHGASWSATPGDDSVWSGPLDGGPARVRYRGAAPIQQLAVRSDDSLLLGDSAGQVTLLDSADAARVVLTLPGPTHLLALGDRGRMLVAADGGGSLRATDLETGEVWAPSWPESPVLGLAAAPTEGIVAAVLDDGTLHAWRPAGGEERTLRGRIKLAGPVVFAPDGGSMATCAVDNELRIWATPALAGRVYRGHAGRVFHPVFLPDGRLATDSDDRTVRLWPSVPGEARVLTGHTDMVYGLEVGPDGRNLVSAAHDGLAIVWDTRTGEGRALRGHDGRVRRAIFTRDGQRVMTGGRDGTLRVWSLDGAPLRVTEAHPGGLHWLALDDEGRRVWTVGQDRRLRRWDPDTGQLDTALVQLGVVGGAVLRVFPLPGEQALTCADDHTLLIASIDAVKRTFVAPYEVVCPSITVSPDHRLAAVPLGSKLSLLELQTGSWRALGGLPDEIHSVAWSPDGRLLAIAGLDGTARVLRVTDGAGAVSALSEAGILGVEFSPDGRELAVAGIDRLLRVTPVDEAALLPPDPAALHAYLTTLTRGRFETPGN